MNSLINEQVAVVGTIDPDAYAAGAVTSDYADATNFETIAAVVMVGTLGTSATVDAKLVQATDSSGTDSKDITGKTITQLTEAGTDSDKQAIIEVRASELDVTNGFTHVAVTVTVGTATSDAGAIVLGGNSRFAPASGADLASVDEIVA